MGLSSGMVSVYLKSVDLELRIKVWLKICILDDNWSQEVSQVAPAKGTDWKTEDRKLRKLNTCGTLAERSAGLQWKMWSLINISHISIYYFSSLLKNCGKVHKTFTIFTISKCTVHWHQAHSQCCVTVNHNPFPELFPSFQTEILYPLNTNSIMIPSFSPGQPPFYLLSLWIWLLMHLTTSYKWNHTMLILLWQAYFM